MPSGLRQINNVSADLYVYGICVAYWLMFFIFFTCSVLLYFSNNIIPAQGLQISFIATLA